jgi:hypothetical protein
MAMVSYSSRRGSDGLFAFQYSRPLSSDNSGLLAAGDIDGDGVDELAPVSAVAVSPSDGLRRLLPVAGLPCHGRRVDVVVALGQRYFPGNPVAPWI